MNTFAISALVASASAVQWKGFLQNDGQPKTTTMQPDTCFYLHLEESTHSGVQDMVLTRQDNKGIVHHFQPNDPTQMWYQSGEKNTICNYGSVDESGERCLAFNQNHAVLNEPKDAAWRNQWFYDSERQTLTQRIEGASPDMNDYITSRYLSVPKENLMPGSEVRIDTARTADDQNYHWRIDYSCTNVDQHIATFQQRHVADHANKEAAAMAHCGADCAA